MAKFTAWCQRSMAILCVIGGLFPATVQASTFEDGWAHYQQGDFYGAVQIWLPLAESGDARAQYNVGLMFDEGRGVVQDQGKRWNGGNVPQGAGITAPCTIWHWPLSVEPMYRRILAEP
ncbi:MAG: sel1 repeat family protein [Rhodospirillales bacterium]|jgi:TPR repeat protein|nr:sel1 repeat family protein [Rhodospirillales bacterium]MBT4039900.1 sel1 repeat family protein [Rhodospirillales bacterium]MBT4627279.1 sel1 repeat family protein [Rhodospirillales bacterium]MBT5351242.1 sel1 repeat family protein [Rhodospirillales bacterium]MBT5520079.1 sel1 repeat family protein [Rhodospirillales bacterium]